MEPSSNPSPTEDALLRHGSFVRALARSLVRDVGLAEDVGQDAWTRWIQRPPRGAGERGWLRAVVRNLATNRMRAEARRERHEELAAAPEALRSSAELAQHAELLGKLVAAVLALEPAQRDTIVALYFRGLDAGTLASESSTPLATVRDRRRRALETLRLRLDRDFGGRAAWAAAIGGFSGAREGAPAPHAGAGGAGVALKLLLGAGAVVAGVVLWKARAPEPDRVVDSPAAIAVTREAQEAAPQQPEQTTSAMQPAETPGSTRALRASEPSPPTAARSLAASTNAEIRGQFVFADGTPAAGVEVVLSIGGMVFKQPRGPEPVRPADWQDVTAVTSTDGAFVLCFQPSPGFSSELAARAAGCAEASWSWMEVEPGEVKRLGKIELFPAAILEGRVVDTTGNPLIGHAWRVGVTSIGLQTQAGREEVRLSAVCDPATAAFRLEGAMPGANAVEATCPLARTGPAPLTLAPGQVTLADLRYAGPDLARRVVLTVSTPRKGPYRSRPATEHMKLFGAGTTLTPAPVEGSASSYAFDGLELGVYALEIDDPAFTPWRQDGIVPGSVVSAELEGSASVLLVVLDAETREPVELYSVRMTLLNASVYPNEFMLHEGNAPLAGSRLAGLLPGDLRLDLEAGERACSVEVDDLGPGETRLVRVLLVRSCGVAGHVRDAGGAPYAGLELLLLRPAELEDSDLSPVARANTIVSPQGLHRHEIAATTTDETGAFAFVAPGAGAVLLAVVSPGEFTPLTPPFELGVGERRDGLDLVLARPGSLALTVRAPAGQSTEGLRLLVGSDPINSGASGLLPLELGTSGRVELEGLRPGNYRAFLLLPETIQHRGNGWTSDANYSFLGDEVVNALDLGTFALESGAHLERELAPALAEWPGLLELLVRVNGEPAPRVHVDLRGDDPFASLALETDADGRVSTPCFAGAWSATIRDPLHAWSAVEPEPLVVLPARATVRTLELELER